MFPNRESQSTDTSARMLFVLDHFGPTFFRSRAFQWVVLPSDGLIKEDNTITLCRGGELRSTTVTLGLRTLAVTISK